jgi:glutathione S-transferase
LGPTALAIAPGERDYGAYLDFLLYADATITFPQSVFLRFAVFEADSGLAPAGDAYATWFERRLVMTERHLESR